MPIAKSVVANPTERLASGRVGEPLLVLSLPDIRNAEDLTVGATLLTADGYVNGREGDIVLTAYGGERYPILASVFFGAYEELARVGERIVARRLIHARRAWPVESDGAAFNYGDNRDTVPIDRRGWLYQSDDDDYGVLNSSVKHKGHSEVGTARGIEATDWEALLGSRLTVLAFLPALLTLLALVAFAASLRQDLNWLVQGCLEFEATLLGGGAASVW